jgi:hypothetical protein
LGQQLFLVPASYDIDLGHGDLIQPRPDNGPHRREGPRGIDDVEFAHTLWVTILADGGGFKDVIFDVVKVGEGDVVEVEDRAGGFDGVSDGCGACGESFCNEFFVF